MEVAVHKKTKKVEGQDGDDYSIKPTAVTPSIDTSNWPLLLKNYDKRESQLVPDPPMTHGRSEGRCDSKKVADID
jgi:H/ACA ribonucleoprotein complex subunit 4